MNWGYLIIAILYTVFCVRLGYEDGYRDGKADGRRNIL